MGSAELVAKKLETIPTVSTLTAQYMSTNPDGTVQVNFGQGAVTVYSAGFYTPLPGEWVRAIKLDAFTMMLGPVAPKSAYGRVTATGTPYLTVMLPDGVTTVTLPYVAAYTPAVNDDVLINWGNGGMVVGKVSAVPVSGYLPPPAPVGGSAAPAHSGSVDFRATDSGSYDPRYGSWFQNDVWAGANSAGAWFYGSTIADTIPDGATVTLVNIRVTEFYDVGSDALFGTHALTGKTGAPNALNPVTIPSGTGYKTLPTSFGDLLKTGAAQGIATSSGNYFHKYRGRAADAQSGLLHIEWSI